MKCFSQGGCVKEPRGESNTFIQNRDSGKKEKRFDILPTFLTVMVCNLRNITEKMKEGVGYIRQNNFVSSNVNSSKKYSIE